MILFTSVRTFCLFFYYFEKPPTEIWLNEHTNSCTIKNVVNSVLINLQFDYMSRLKREKKKKCITDFRVTRPMRIKKKCETIEYDEQLDRKECSCASSPWSLEGNKHCLETWSLKKNVWVRWNCRYLPSGLVNFHQNSNLLWVNMPIGWHVLEKIYRQEIISCN